MSRRSFVVGTVWLAIGVVVGSLGILLLRKWLLPVHVIGWRSVNSSGVALPESRREEWSTRMLSYFGTDLTQLALVTPVPVKATPEDWMSCEGPPIDAENVHQVIRGAINVYISPESEEALREGANDYPEGTVVLKQKLSSEAQTVLFTGMLKREAGYNPDCGDWEFFVLGPGARLQARGRIESCMACHQEYAEAGFLSRLYLTLE
jgi:hypothetical protein